MILNAVKLRLYLLGLQVLSYLNNRRDALLQLPDHFQLPKTENHFGEILPLKDTKTHQILCCKHNTRQYSELIESSLLHQFAILTSQITFFQVQAQLPFMPKSTDLKHYRKSVKQQKHRIEC
jgi:hypothetical protein